MRATALPRRWPFPSLVQALTVLALLGAAVAAARLVLGLGATTNLNDGYPWGLWIAADVVVGTAFATGGYAVALLVYILNRGRYHPLVRPAILASALGYSLAGLAVALDVGRWWGIWKVPLLFWHWNPHSVLLEVALCIMAYVLVLWIEAAPPLLAQVAETGPARMRPYAARARRVLDRTLLWVIALGILLPTMHQSSLGSLMYLAGPRLHELWRTPLLPLLYLITAVGMGYAVVLAESVLSQRMFHRRPDVAMLRGLAFAITPALALYAVVRLGDLLWQGRGPALLAGDRFSVMVWVELVLAGAPLAIVWAARRTSSLTRYVQAALLALAAGTVYRFDTYLLAFRPGDHWTYFPGVLEIAVTVGLFSFEILAYITLVRLFPALLGEETRAAVPAGQALPAGGPA